MTLDEAITQLIELGYKDPLDIDRELVRRHGEEWLHVEADPHAFARDRARYLLGRRRRAAEARVALHIEPVERIAEVRLESRWVEGKGRIRVCDLTAEDCDTIAAHHRKLEVWNAHKAEMYEGFAANIREAGVERLGDVPGLLPAAVAA